VGTERFDPTCGRSPIGRKLRYPILDNGTFGLGWNGASPCHSYGHRDIETRQVSSRRGRCSQYLPRAFESTSSGLRDCYALLWDPKLSKVVGLAGSGCSPKSLSLENVRSRSKNGVIPKLGGSRSLIGGPMGL
jgi:hypothetical protein